MNVQDMFTKLGALGLQQEMFHEDMGWDEYVQEMSKLQQADDKGKLKELLHMKAEEDMVNEASLEAIMRTNFTNAKEVIDKMTIAKRISILEELDTYKSYLYESLGRFGAPGVPKDEQLSANDFRALLGRIKHLEILQNWLYGIE